MATRAQARESVVGLIYALGVGNDTIAKYADTILENKKIRNKQKEFALGLFNGTVEHLEEIDKAILENLSTNDMESVGKIEKSILRTSIYEILFTPTQKAIVINEAIELAKRLASDTSPKFINGVLDKINKI